MTDRITDAELDVMDVLWAESPLPASDVAERLEARRDWSAQTVKTLLSRLVEKGALDAAPDGRRFLYRPVVSREAYVASMAGGVIDRLFGGRAAPLVANLAESGRLSDDDLAELETLIRELKDAR